MAINRFEFCFFTNLANAFPSAALAASIIPSVLPSARREVSLASNFGEIEGWSSPSQGYRIWSRWLPTDRDYVATGDVAPWDAQELRRTILQIQAYQGRPFINKWQRLATRIELLNGMFPEALFLRMTRSIEYVAQSLLIGRRERFGDENVWLSARPRQRIESTDPAIQVTDQAFFLDQEAAIDLAKIGIERSFEIQYEKLCTEPQRELDAFGSWYTHRTKWPLRRKHYRFPTLGSKNSIRLDDPTLRKIMARLDELRHTTHQ
jgi:hypothetical protein